jgi:hypothetical protein
MEEMMRMGVEVGVVMGWIQQGVFSAAPITPQVMPNFGRAVAFALASTLGTYANFGY